MAISYSSTHTAPRPGAAIMSSANPRRRSPAVTRPGSDDKSGLSLKTAMALRKGATFHSPTSPVCQSADDAFAPPQLFRSQTHMNDVVNANLRRVAMTLDYVNETLSPKKHQCLSRKNSNDEALRDTGFPIPRGFLDAPVVPVVDPTMATSEPKRRVLRPRSLGRSKQRGDADSGLGSSVASTNVAAGRGTKSQASAPALTRSAAPSTKDPLPALGQRAFNTITGRILSPLLAKSDLRDFHPIVRDIPYLMRTKKILCLRDVEKTLILRAPGVAETAELYRSFCIESIHCIQATYELLSDRQQTRPGDRPYTSGYFIDLTEQILAYGKQLRAGKTDTHEDTDVDQTDEVKLVGGIVENGRPAELVRVKKDGTIISMATGEPVDMDGAPAKTKRSLSEQRDNDEEIMRSMARRKKNASPEELAPKKCREPGCDKEFKRPCDLTKHEKTHSRPWKCPIPTCRYHEFGWPTEKEMDRHVNDKHSDAPAMYECGYPPCPYKSKRESNCKQHMEKAHGWHYVRTKTNGKKAPENTSSSVHQTPPLGSMSTPSTTPAYSVPTPPQERETMASDFPRYEADADWFATYGLPPDTIDAMDLVLENPSPSSAASHESYPPYQNGSTFLMNPEEDIYAAQVQVQVQAQVPFPHGLNMGHLYGKLLPQQMPVYSHQPGPNPQPQLVVAPHFSPAGQGNAMLYTPNSLREVDEGFDESFGADGVDFELYPANLNKGNGYHPSFGEVPSANLGFSQTTQPDMFQQLDWPIPLGPYQAFQE
ncbi:Zinc finger transcription factor ace1 [Tolypocladium capitatum]|uniref:Zinc finger transcription factor ace1 n=1 Tax=Tolypocladium capitatum TaxID=45235 RepID=A0A2K3Q805_9HYPO|nr:Zinc finger transcription factor ace1 [Tolypocladium capitatum]